jgi:hypothetical protein
MVRGDCGLREWFTAGRGLAMVKTDVDPEEKVRPISVGECFTRRCTTHILKWKVPDYTKVLSRQQFGVGSEGGVEPVLAWLEQRAFEEKGVLSIDFSNAFNEVSRIRVAEAIRSSVPGLWSMMKWLYQEPSNLLFRHQNGEIVTVTSETGFKQGESIGSFGFSLAIKPLFEELRSRVTQSWSLSMNVGESIDVIGPVSEVADDGAAFIDDIYVPDPASDEASEKIMDWLGSEPTVSEYGVRFNREKSGRTKGHELKTVGMKALGSWVGGPKSAESKGAELVVKVWS